MSLNIDRLAAEIRASVKRIGLNLHGERVLTEAGTGYYAVTPVIAALAGAEVTAVSKTTSYGTFEAVEALVRTLEDRLSPVGKIVLQKREAIPPDAKFDIITNLGHLRPLDADFLARYATSNTVIPYMCEAWEFRQGDLDLDYCRQNGIKVAGTNEWHPAVDCFRTCGVIVARLLLERDYQLRGGKYAVVSPDRFGDVVAEYLTNAGGEVVRTSLLDDSTLRDVASCEAVILADYTSEHELIGPEGLSPAKLREANPAIELILLAGATNLEACHRAGLPVYPAMNLPPKRMSRTLAYVGPRPVVDLHTAGLKVGELLRRREVTELVQPMT